MQSQDEPRFLADLKEGLAVCFASGRRAGSVAGIRPGSFSLKDMRGELIWLRNEVIFTVDKRQVDLLCEAEGLHNYVAPN